MQSSLVRNEAPSANDVPMLGAGNQAFAFDLYRQLATYSDGQNMVFSPFSVSSALAMVYAGARTTTATELASTLHFTLPAAQLHEAFNATDLALRSRGRGLLGADGQPFALEVSNDLWAQGDTSVEQPFLDTLAVNYGAGVREVDFAHDADSVHTAINEQVSSETHGRIPEILPAGVLDSLTRFVLTNAVYFNAAWQSGFEPTQTRDAPFTRADGSTVTTSMMRATELFPFVRGANYGAIALPFNDSNLSLVAVLPNDGAFASVEASMTADWWASLERTLTSTQVTLAFPKLDLRASSQVQAALCALGFSAACPNGNADLTGITNDSSLEISGILHQATLQTNESGTIASAATEVTIATRSATLPQGEVLAFDHPFLFAIFDHDTGTLLFLGRVLDPTAK